MRNPFKKNDENVRPPPTVNGTNEAPSTSSVNKVDVNGEKQPVEYKLSEINDSGVYLPPSPTEKKNFWGTTASRSTTSSSLHRCAFDENEQFNISRESFDSYRRSFDISARSPIIQPLEGRPRASLDSRTFQSPPRNSNSYHRPLQVPHTQEEDKFEDVNIDDPKPQPQKKRGIFARMLDSDDHTETNGRPQSSQEKTGVWNTITGRKRGQSGQGSELGAIPKREATPKPENVRPEATAKPETVKEEEPVQVKAVQPDNGTVAKPEPKDVPQTKIQQNGDVAKAPKPENTQAPEVKVDS
ncbi:hypothetical protein M409DRAFT_49994 [Zasmidium cellare ATCC 36951]|uniref:Uncharacterized protein n=1 Tax=Zasmidium cellare ATCC 36951 TaxID=1080233 RepID=A0A6A6D258_ZASCE|nr:uncharacterized protein M409DRAFT_49994 [Zasmidium cellare ATCC 36951]KAF2172272.1 hypothetical protein M409DRAFT_49994 [Zasmidium cellare ATCC 36951]